MDLTMSDVEPQIDLATAIDAALRFAAPFVSERVSDVTVTEFSGRGTQPILRRSPWQGLADLEVVESPELLALTERVYAARPALYGSMLGTALTGGVAFAPSHL